MTNQEQETRVGSQVTVAGIQRYTDEASAGGEHNSGVSYGGRPWRSEASCRLPIWSRGASHSVKKIKDFVKDLKRDRRIVTRCWGEDAGIFARDAVPVNILSMGHKSQLPSVDTEELCDDQVYDGRRGKFDLGFQGNMRGASMEEAP